MDLIKKTDFVLTMYSLDEDNNVLSHTAQEFRDLFIDPESRHEFQRRRIIKQEIVNGVFISTLFLMIDYRFSIYTENVKPILFETMIFEKDEDGDSNLWGRYCSYDDSLTGHQAAVLQYQDALPHTPPLIDPPTYDQ